MSEKHVILMNYTTVNSGRPTQINVGTWSDAKQQEFLEIIRNLKKENYGTFSCCFDVFYGNETAFEVRPWQKHVATEWKPHDCINPAMKNEIVIVMRPGMLKNTDCVVSRIHDCPICMRNGQCAAPFIRKFGKILFPNKYDKNR